MHTNANAHARTNARILIFMEIVDRSWPQASGDVVKELCGSTDDAEPEFPAGCEHLQGDVGARVAWTLLMEMVNQLWFEFEAPRPDLAEILAILEVASKPLDPRP